VVAAPGAPANGAKLPRAAEKRGVPIAPRTAQVDPKIYDAYVGRYQYSIMTGTVYAYTVVRQGDTLTAKGRDDPKCTLLPLSETRFGTQIGESSFLSAPRTAACSASNIKDSDNRHTELYVTANPPH
jgi:hypothetical protein